MSEAEKWALPGYPLITNADTPDVGAASKWLSSVVENRNAPDVGSQPLRLGATITVSGIPCINAPYCSKNHFRLNIRGESVLYDYDVSATVVGSLDNVPATLERSYVIHVAPSAADDPPARDHVGPQDAAWSECKAAIRAAARASYSHDVSATATADDPPARDHVGPQDAAHGRVHEVIGDIIAGRVTKPARDALGKALEKADAPPARRAKSDESVNRAFRLVWS